MPTLFTLRIPWIHWGLTLASGGWWAGELMPSPQRTAATQSGLLSQPPTCQEISICPVQSFITFKHWVLSAVWKTHSVIRHDLTSTDVRSPYVITEKNQKKIFLKFWYFIFVCLGHMACRFFPSHAGSVSWRRCISVFVCHSNAAGRGIGSSKESRKQFNCYDFSFYYLWILASDREKKSFLFHGWGSGGGIEWRQETLGIEKVLGRGEGEIGKDIGGVSGSQVDRLLRSCK